MDDNDLFNQVARLPREKLVRVVEELHGRLTALEEAQTEPLAIIGIACRFPGGADTPDAYWARLAAGFDAVRALPEDRRHAVFGAEDDGRPLFGAFLEDAAGFDAGFFGITPREAQRMDPQQRLFLELAWEALEDAGLPRDRLGGSRTGVFAALCDNAYVTRQFAAGVEVDLYSGVGASASALAGRLSYLLDLGGPSFAVDTACSSSLVALHLAGRSLRVGETDMALVGAANIFCSRAGIEPFERMGLLSPDHACRTFDAGADGFVGGEGGGAVVLKRLSDALADDDRIHAVIRGTAVNHCGRSAGLTAPNGRAQAAVIRAALDDAGLPPDAIGLIEAHGTATRLGDPVEVEALAEALGRPPAGAPPRLAVEEFRSQNGLRRKGDRQVTLTDQQLSELNSRLVIARSDLAQKQARLDQARSVLRSRGSAESTTDVLQSPLIQRLREQESSLLREMSDALKIYGDRHPRLVGLRAELNGVRGTIGVEVEKISSSFANDVEVAAAGVKSLGRQLDGVRQQAHTGG
ncbi:beta-ketoacyl synthase N-terminal-like domain-containing protein, partial [Azospirillum sp. B506]|uniref:beta-ketoacyl synthase N-terminal-like domain-containing protein n=1 Tax=Azospirillum sp. B506 TaxID=137721 RepID=UPI00244DE9EE